VVGNTGYSIIQNGDFENWSSNTPSSWTITGGTAGADIFQETGASNVYRGSSSLKFVNAAAAATLGVSQAISTSQLTARRMYNVSIRIKASGVPAAGTITIQHTGTGYTAASTEKITIAHGSFPTSWTLYNFWISMPAIIPSDWALAITISGTLSAATNVFMDSLAYTPAQYHGGLAAVAVEGSTRFVNGDQFSFTVANDDGGVFQKFFREWFGFQLPSSGSPNISESLAT
jgi:hypothetical protein